MNRRAKFSKNPLETLLYGWDIYNDEITEEIMDLVRTWLADAFDEGVSAAGRYGHEDNWDSEDNPYNDNPYRTEG